MRRREFIKLVGGVATWPLAAGAQPLGKPPTIGLLLPNTVALDAPRVGALMRRLRELGWIEGRNIALEYRWAEGRTEHLADQAQAREVLSAARNRGLELHVLNAGNESDFDAVFADIKRLRVGGLVIGAGPVFLRSLNKLATLTVRHAVPAIYLYRTFPVAGGLMSYGSDIFESYRLAGVYTGRVLKGENPAELPVVQATKFALIINLKTAKALGITVPNTLIGRADELIE